MSDNTFWRNKTIRYPRMIFVENELLFYFGTRGNNEVGWICVDLSCIEFKNAYFFAIMQEGVNGVNGLNGWKWVNRGKRGNWGNWGKEPIPPVPPLPPVPQFNPPHSFTNRATCISRPVCTVRMYCPLGNCCTRIVCCCMSRSNGWRSIMRPFMSLIFISPWVSAS